MAIRQNLSLLSSEFFADCQIQAFGDMRLCPRSPLTNLLVMGAAIAYFGRDGSELLPLLHGDRVVVDTGLASVKESNNNPFEIERLIDRGLEVFTRQD